MREDRNDPRIFTRRSHPGSGQPAGPWTPEEHRFRGRPVAPSSNDYREEYERDEGRTDEYTGHDAYIGSGDGYGRGPTYAPRPHFGDTSRYAGADAYYDHGERWNLEAPRNERGWNRDDFDRTWSHRPERAESEDTRHSFVGRDWRNSNGSGRGFERDDWRRYGGESVRRFEEERSHGEGIVDAVKNFFGVGPKGYRRSDERILEDANEALAHDSRLDASNIEVSCAGGVLTLTGTVTDRWSKWRAEDDVERLSGVQDVQNRLTIAKERGFDEDQSILHYGAAAQVSPGAAAAEAPAIGEGAQANLDSHEGRGRDEGGNSANEGGFFGERGLEGTTATGGFNNTVVVHPADPIGETADRERSA